MTMFKKIVKMLGGASALAALAVVALLSVVLGCGGSVTGDQAPGNAVTIDLAGAPVVAPDSVSTVGFTMSNVSGSAVTSIIYFNSEGASVTQTMNPPVPSGRSIAAVARVRVSQVTNTDANGATTTTYTSTTNSISMVVVLANESNKAITVGISIDQATGQLTLTNATATIDITN